VAAIICMVKRNSTVPPPENHFTGGSTVAVSTLASYSGGFGFKSPTFMNEIFVGKGKVNGKVVPVLN
jgi:hypothetical protein